MATTEQLQAIRQRLGIAQPATPVDNVINTRKQELDSAWSSVDVVSDKTHPIIKEAGKNLYEAISGTGKYEGENPVVRGVQGATEALSVPVKLVTNAIPQSVKDVTEKVLPIGKLISQLGDLFGSTELAQKFVAQHPEATKTMEDFSKIGQAGGEVAGNILAAEGIGKSGAITEDITKSVKGKVINPIKEKILPTSSAEKLTGEILQGKIDDIASGKSGLSNLDTSNVKSYKQLKDTAQSGIKDFSNKQDILLESDKIPKKVQSLATPVKIGDTTTYHNYVLDAVKQLKDQYIKTNDIKNSKLMDSYIEKLHPTKGKGLTIKEVNDIARKHGSDLNAFNANGELSSGLTKQAAENTRIGLKDTIKNNLSDELKNEFKKNDKAISDISTVRDLSAKMEEKVNTLSNRLQKPNILQKIGGLLGKATRITGIGDFAQKLLGIEKVPGASSLNAIELENQLSKNLKRIDEALSKNDTDFIKTITEIAKEK